MGKTALGKLEDGKYILEAVFTLRQDIARPKPFTVEGGADNSQQEAGAAGS